MIMHIYFPLYISAIWKFGRWFMSIWNMQMALIARIQHPYIVEFKEAWVEKVIVHEASDYQFCIWMHGRFWFW